jgi:hypothetical protein
VQMFDTHGEMMFADWMVWWCFRVVLRPESSYGGWRKK